MVDTIGHRQTKTSGPVAFEPIARGSSATCIDFPPYADGKDAVWHL